MEKLSRFAPREKLNLALGKIKGIFVKKSDSSEKPEVNWNSFKAIGLATVVLFVAIVLLLPNEQSVEFSTKVDPTREKNVDESNVQKDANGSDMRRVDSVWAAPRSFASSGGSGSEVNYNTSMVLGSKAGNAKTQLRAGQRLPLRILDKFIVSDSPVPVLAELILNTETDSGLKLPARTRFYGEATFGRGQERAQVRFTQISLPSGEIREISSLALGKDGQPGIPGKVFSDGTKNTAGQVITTFVAGMAAGSVETDIFGGSKGGIQNGLLSAVAATAKDRAQSYGEKLKAEREWIEVGQGAECDAALNQSLNLQNGGDL